MMSVEGKYVGYGTITKVANNVRSPMGHEVGLQASAGRGFSPPTCIVLYCCYYVAALCALLDPAGLGVLTYFIPCLQAKLWFDPDWNGQCMILGGTCGLLIQNIIELPSF